MQWATMSSGRVILNEPRNDLAKGVRKLSTTTASRATTFHSERNFGKWYAEDIRSALRREIDENGPARGRFDPEIVSGSLPATRLFPPAGGAGLQRPGRSLRGSRGGAALPAWLAAGSRRGPHFRPASPAGTRP